MEATMPNRRMTKAERLAEAQPIDLQEWLGIIAEADASGIEEEKGACILKDPVTGQPYCTRTTPEACKKLKGFWVGGPCGG
jgi:hypothetical protein